jgi:hypothetical protein
LLSDDIINKHKKKETCVPGPNHYISTQWQKSSLKGHAQGVYHSKGERTSFVMQPSAILENVPSPDRYEKVRLEGYLPRTPQVKIHTAHFPRFKPIEKTGDPSPSTYDQAGSITKTMW